MPWTGCCQLAGREVLATLEKGELVLGVAQEGGSAGELAFGNGRRTSMEQSPSDPDQEQPTVDANRPSLGTTIATGCGCLIGVVVVIAAFLITLWAYGWAVAVCQDGKADPGESCNYWYYWLFPTGVLAAVVAAAAVATKLRNSPG